MSIEPEWLGGNIDKYSTHWSGNFSHEDLEPRYHNYTHDMYYLAFMHERSISEDEINSITPDMMPGFRLTWSYNEELVPDDWFKNDNRYMNKEFVR